MMALWISLLLLGLGVPLPADAADDILAEGLISLREADEGVARLAELLLGFV